AFSGTSIKSSSHSVPIAAIRPQFPLCFLANGLARRAAICAEQRPCRRNRAFLGMFAQHLERFRQPLGAAGAKFNREMLGQYGTANIYCRGNFRHRQRGRRQRHHHFTLTLNRLERLTPATVSSCLHQARSPYVLSLSVRVPAVTADDRTCCPIPPDGLPVVF